MWFGILVAVGILPAACLVFAAVGWLISANERSQRAVMQEPWDWTGFEPGSPGWYRFHQGSESGAREILRFEDQQAAQKALAWAEERPMEPVLEKRVPEPPPVVGGRKVPVVGLDRPAGANQAHHRS